MNIQIGSKIRRLRENKGFSQEEMAERLQISRSAYSRIESGETNSWVNHIQKLCENFDIKPEDFFINSDNNINTNQDNASAVQANTHHDTHITINQLSEKVIELYEERIRELKEQVEFWKTKNS
ncbi:helix-turn-helix domain-containing protein [Chryseobacterium sp. ES2]|uniref:Helix-turn-helix domain-containing protein n=1 Tax=Chryseobacterium metallicongregator TaxID=3073042 RepID=A0ABU1E568_9FLAO|nr:helix-turn-helix domain-containing protein [Chryseobacterium sp. ES2]MDR4952940.1 helix-turn-helix domain-containing protein [Chryseobacterium sp. ES2]